MALLICWRRNHPLYREEQHCSGLLLQKLLPCGSGTYFSISYCEENLENTVCHRFSEDVVGRPLLILGSDGLGSYHLLCGFILGTVLVEQKVCLHLRRVNSFEVKLHQQLSKACGLSAEVAEVCDFCCLPAPVCHMHSKQQPNANAEPL